MLTEKDQYIDPASANHPKVRWGRVGVLLVNLGTPDAPTPSALRRYLAQFLSDRRIIEIPQIAWQPILRGIILNTRPARSAKAYVKIWMQDTNESPLRRYTRGQSEGLAARIGTDHVVVDWAMRYGNPSIDSRLAHLQAEGCDRILIVPLYPQYSATTTASVTDAVFRALMRLRWQPTIRIAPPFHDDPVYIEAVAASIRTARAALDFEPDVTMLSYHGIPEQYFRKGDPYFCHCAKTSRLVRTALGETDQTLITTFQSRFGPQAWLQPYTDVTLEALPDQGRKRVLVAAPAFISDCVETLEELGLEGRHAFMEAGGEHFALVPCLNDSADAIRVLESVALRELAGWI